jgi:hypothetical protein
MGITTANEYRFVGHPDIIGQKSMFVFASRATPKAKDKALQLQIGRGSATHWAPEPACHRGHSPLKGHTPRGQFSWADGSVVSAPSGLG